MPAATPNRLMGRFPSSKAGIESAKEEETVAAPQGENRGSSRRYERKEVHPVNRHEPTR